jgi:hypothetical protein
MLKSCESPIKRPLRHCHSANLLLEHFGGLFYNRLRNQLPVGLENDAGIGRDRDPLDLAKRIEVVIGAIAAPV